MRGRPYAAGYYGAPTAWRALPHLRSDRDPGLADLSCRHEVRWALPQDCLNRRTRLTRRRRDTSDWAPGAGASALSADPIGSDWATAVVQTAGVSVASTGSGVGSVFSQSFVTVNTFDVDAVGARLAAGCRVGTHMPDNSHAQDESAAGADVSARAPASVLFGAAALFGLLGFAMRNCAAGTAGAVTVARLDAARAGAATAGIIVGGVTVGGGAENAARVGGATVSLAGVGARVGGAALPFLAGAAGAAAALVAVAEVVAEGKSAVLAEAAGAFSSAKCCSLAQSMTLRATVGLVLPGEIAEALLLIFPAAEEPPDDFGALRGVFPAQEFGVAFGPGPRQECCLLAHSLSEACEKGLKISQADGADASVHTLIQMARIGFVVRLEFGKLCYTRAELPLACDKRLGAAAFGILDGTLKHAQPFNSFHEVTLAFH